MASSLLFTTAAYAQSPLPADVMPGTTTRTEPRTYLFEAPGAGLLTVVVRGTDADLRLTVTDSDGQTIAETDGDIGGDGGAEQLSVQIDGPGRYLVIVNSYDERGAFKLGSTFLPFPELARPPDDDGSPLRATPLDLPESGSNSRTIADSIDPDANDLRDWFVVTAPSSGTLTVVTRGASEQERSSSGDLVLEAFTEDSFRTSLERSDRDSQGDGTNESITLSTTANQKLYFRVTAGLLSTGATAYRITASFIPD